MKDRTGDFSSLRLPHWGIRTRSVHAGEYIDPHSRASSPNIVMSATFAPEEVSGFSALAGNTHDGHIYARVSSPTASQLERKIAELENGAACRSFASGMAACSALILGRLSSGDHMIMNYSNYVGTAELARYTLPRFGISVSFVNSSNPDELANAIQENTRMIWLETPANPAMQISDIKAIADIGRSRGIEDIVVDSTFASPIATRPLELGAEFVVHSLTKYIGGHGDAMGGAVVGPIDKIEYLSTEAGVHYGGVVSPFNAWLIMRGAETLPLRMQAHQEAAFKVARYLEAHPKITALYYPGLPSHPEHDVACRQMDNFSGLMSFQIAGNGEEMAKRMIDECQIMHYAVSLGHVRSLIYWIDTEAILHSSFYSDEKHEKIYRDRAGAGLFRLSVGIEDGDDICAEFDRILR